MVECSSSCGPIRTISHGARAAGRTSPGSPRSRGRGTGPPWRRPRRGSRSRAPGRRAGAVSASAQRPRCRSSRPARSVSSASMRAISARPIAWSSVGVEVERGVDADEPRGSRRRRRGRGTCPGASSGRAAGRISVDQGVVEPGEGGPDARRRRPAEPGGEALALGGGPAGRGRRGRRAARAAASRRRRPSRSSSRIAIVRTHRGAAGDAAVGEAAAQRRRAWRSV